MTNPVFREVVTDEESLDYLAGVVEELVKLGQSYEQAIERVNRRWSGSTITGDHMLYHETPEHWAKTILYGHNYWRYET